MTFLAFNILQSGVTLSMVCAAVGLAFAFFLIKAVIRLSPGNERMRQIAGAIEEGAKAYLARQVKTISAIAVVIFVLLFCFRDGATAAGFLALAVVPLRPSLSYLRKTARPPSHRVTVPPAVDGSVGPPAQGGSVGPTTQGGSA